MCWGWAQRPAGSLEALDVVLCAEAVGSVDAVHGRGAAVWHGGGSHCVGDALARALGGVSLRRREDCWFDASVRSDLQARAIVQFERFGVVWKES